MRRELEDTVDNKKWTHCSPIAINYKSAPKKKQEGTSGQCNICARLNVESGIVQARFSSSRWQVKERRDFNDNGVKDSHDASYSRMTARCRMSLERSSLCR